MLFQTGEQLVKPWSWNIFLELTVWFIVFLLTAGIWIWTRSGKDRKSLPDVMGRNIEDFAGITQESNAPIPLFLLLFYVVVALFMIGYPAVTLIFNYNY